MRDLRDGWPVVILALVRRPLAARDVLVSLFVLVAFQMTWTACKLAARAVFSSNEVHTFSRLPANNMLFAILVSICTRMLSSIRPRSASLVLPDISLLSITPAIIYYLRLFNVQMMIPPDHATQSQSDILDLGKLREDDSSYFSDNRRG